MNNFSQGNDRNKSFSSSRPSGFNDNNRRPDSSNGQSRGEPRNNRDWKDKQNYQSPYPSQQRGGFNNNRPDPRDRNQGQQQQNNRGVFAALPQGANKQIPALLPGKIRVVPVGGQGELGRSCWIFEQENEIVIVDAGVGFVPHGVKGGVDLILPNIDYLLENKNKITGLVMSNPHEEYAGNLLDFINQLEIKQVYLPNVLSELYKTDFPADLKVTKLQSGEKYNIGSKFVFSAFQVSFSAVDSFAFLIEGANTRIFYTGAFKIDHTPPVEGNQIELSRLASSITEQGVDLLISSSINVETPGYTNSESSVIKRLSEISSQVTSRMITLYAASNIHRLDALLKVAKKTNRKVCLVGKETNDWFRAAVGVGYLQNTQDLIIKLDQIKDFKPSEILIVIGSLEGDVLKPFIDLAYNRHPELSLLEGDTLIVSANPPLGTSRMLANAVDQLFIQGVSVIGGREAGVNVSGYASQEELKFMYNLARPKYFLPSHGETRQLVLHAELLGKCGLDPKKIIIVDNGTAIDFDAPNKVTEIAGRIEASPVFFNKSMDSEMDQQSLDERRNLGQDGTLTVVMALNLQKGLFFGGPLLKTAGSSFNSNKHWLEIEKNMIADIHQAVDKALKAGQKEVGVIRHITHDVLSKRIREKFGMSRPVVSIVVQEIQ
jgi:ribonuclease J